MSKVLIVDDSPILRSTMRNVLEKSGYSIVGEAANAEEAMSQFGRLKPEVVLLDVLLPGESGLEVLKKLKAVDPTAKVLIITAVNQDAVNDEAKALGAKGIIFKPFDPVELSKTIETILS